MEKILIIVRGIPGSGKSTFASLLTSPEYICTADDYHMIDGEYQFKKENLMTAHLACESKCEDLMKKGVDRIVIANTSSSYREFYCYYDLAKMYDYKVFSIIVENRHGGKNIHGAPEETIEKMIERFDIKLI